MCSEPYKSGLASLAAAGDERSMDALFSGLLPVIRAEAKTFTCPPQLTLLDLIQEGFVGAVKAVNSFDESKGASFETYARVCIRNAIATALKAQGRAKHQPLNSSVPLEDIPPEHVSDTHNPEKVLSMQENIDAIFRCISEKLSDRERNVLLLHIEGQSYSAISEKLGISYKSVDNALMRARKKISEETTV